MVELIIDSTADLRPGIRDRFNVVPLTVAFGETEYIDGVTITHEEFYGKLIESDVLPTTSQATPAAFEAVFAQVAARGNTAVVLTVASGLSGTYQSARETRGHGISRYHCGGRYFRGHRHRHPGGAGAALPGSGTRSF